jgi:Domain of unknown function (DUF4145)
MPTELLDDHKSVRANCPECKGAMTTYETKGASGSYFDRNEGGAQTTSYNLLRCAGCGRGGLSCVRQGQIHTNRGAQNHHQLLQFFPRSIDSLDLPADLPKDLATEFREAELTASVHAWRGASALMRSTLEKALKHSGYTKGNLKILIDEAAADGAITAARSVRAHEDIRVLGNDILHDDWRAITEEEYELAHRYTQRILEDLYDDRDSVLKLLCSKGRKAVDAP